MVGANVKRFTDKFGRSGIAIHLVTLFRVFVIAHEYTDDEYMIELQEGFETVLILHQEKGGSNRIVIDWTDGDIILEHIIEGCMRHGLERHVLISILSNIHPVIGLKGAHFQQTRWTKHDLCAFTCAAAPTASIAVPPRTAVPPEIVTELLDPVGMRFETNFDHINVLEDAGVRVLIRRGSYMIVQKSSFAAALLGGDANKTNGWTASDLVAIMQTVDSIRPRIVQLLKHKQEFDAMLTTFEINALVHVGFTVEPSIVGVYSVSPRVDLRSPNPDSS